MPTSEHWRKLAACQDKADVFLATSDGGWAYATSKFDHMIIERSKAICSACPVRISCLDYALRNRITHFVYGGLSAPERQKILRDRDGPRHRQPQSADPVVLQHRQDLSAILVDSPDNAMQG